MQISYDIPQIKQNGQQIRYYKSFTLSSYFIMDTTALDIISAMRRQEDSIYLKGDFLCHGDARHCVAAVDADCRAQMVEWCYQIVDFCKFQRECVEIAMSFLDRYLLVDTFVLSDRATFQLASMTSLYMAVKIHEREAMDPATVSALSRGLYTVDDVEEMELKILKALEWRVNPPTSVSFARQLLTLLSKTSFKLKIRETIAHITTMQLELAIGDYNLIRVKPSTIAFCSILNALESLNIAPKAIAPSTTLMARALGIDGHSEDIQKLSNYLLALVAQKEPTMFRHSRGAQSAKASQLPIHGGDAFEVSPRSIAIR